MGGVWKWGGWKEHVNGVGAWEEHMDGVGGGRHTRIGWEEEGHGDKVGGMNMDMRWMRGVQGRVGGKYRDGIGGRGVEVKWVMAMAKSKKQDGTNGRV